MFQAKNKTDGKNYRCEKEADGNVFVFAPRKKRRGWRMPETTFISRYELISEKFTPTEKWHRRIRSAIKKMRASGLWAEMVPLYESLLMITWEDLTVMRGEYWKYYWNQTYRSIYTDKFPFAYTMTDEGGSRLKREYLAETADCKTKSMYFGSSNRRIKDQIRNALEQKTDYRTGRIQVNYDVSFEYNAEKGKAWYSEEYRNCGNGHYFITIDHNTAIFCEDD